MKTILRLCRCERGAEFVEMALAFPLLLLVVAGITEFGLMFQRYEVLTNAAREGARVAVLPDYDAADAEQRVNDYINASFLAGGAAPDVTVGAPVPITVGGACMSTITVTVTYPNSLTFLGGVAGYFGVDIGEKTIAAASSMRTESASGC